LPVSVTCLQCGIGKTVCPGRVATFKFCSYACKGEWWTVNKSGANSPGWSGGERTKVCRHCGKEFSHKPNGTVTAFRKQKFCSKPCADIGGIRHKGPDNGNWNGNPRRKHRDYRQGAWSRRVISRDGAKCRVCGIVGVELHAHHIISYKDNPDKRWDLENGLTVCFACHWQIHSKPEVNGVNSGNAVAVKGAAGNPEPSFERKFVEGVTTRGRAYRRWEGSCEWCGTFISRRMSDIVGKAHICCSKQCAGKLKAYTRTYRPAKNLTPPTAVMPPRAP